jgi:DNA mismatch endonuclease (patch repair protein)
MIPKSQIEFWRSKFRHNAQRDRRVSRDLEALGWNVHVIWECETKDRKVLERRLRRIFDLV